MMKAKTLSSRSIIIMIIRNSYLGHCETETVISLFTRGHLACNNLQFSKNNDFLEYSEFWVFFCLVLQLKFSTHILCQLWFIYFRTPRFPSNLRGEISCDCWKANLKHKESLPLAATVPLRCIHHKHEMGSKRLEHMAFSPSPACKVTRRDFFRSGILYRVSVMPNDCHNFKN